MGGRNLKETVPSAVSDPASFVRLWVVRVSLLGAIAFLPVMGGLHVSRMLAGTYDALAAARLVAHVAVILVLVAWPRRAGAGLAIVGYLAFGIVHAGVQFGVAPSMGLMAVLLVVVAYLYDDVRGLLLGIALHLVLLVGLAVAGTSGLLHGPPPGSLDPTSALVWLRVGVAQLVLVMTISGAVASTVAVTREKVERLTRALERETEARAEAERARAAAEEAREALVRAEQMEAVGYVAAGVAHDLGNALAVVLGSAELLVEGSLGAEDAVLVREIVEGSRSAAMTARYLLTLARQDVIEPERVELSRELVRLSSMLRRVLPDDIDVRVEAEASLGIVIDRLRLERMLVNLALNARDAMPAGGRLLLSARSRGDRVEVAVQDTGVGMDEETLQRALEPLFTTRAGKGGFGMGMAIVLRLAEEAGGTLEIWSELGVGTTATLGFPSAPWEPPSRTLPPSLNDIPRDLRVLLLEDQPAVRAAMERALRRLGCVSVSCGDGRTALDLVQQSDFELLITDGIVPGDVPVRDVIAAWREHRPGSPIVIVSGHVEEELVRRGITAGEFSFVAKPFSLRRLRRAIMEALNSADGT